MNNQTTSAADDDRECIVCGIGLRLGDGLEWPDGDDSILCWECMQESRDNYRDEVRILQQQLAEARAEAAALRAGIGGNE